MLPARASCNKRRGPPFRTYTSRPVSYRSGHLTSVWAALFRPACQWKWRGVLVGAHRWRSTARRNADEPSAMRLQKTRLANCSAQRYVTAPTTDTQRTQWGMLTPVDPYCKNQLLQRGYTPDRLQRTWTYRIAGFHGPIFPETVLTTADN